MRNRFVVLCEGIKDRDFWSGWLDYLGSANSLAAAGGDLMALKARIRPYSLAPGEFCFESAHNDLITVQHCKSRRGVWEASQTLLGKPGSPARIVINVDSDRESADPDPAGGARERFRQLAVDYSPTIRSDSFFQAGETRVDLVVWSCLDPAGSIGVPEQQTLERLICAAIVEASMSDSFPQGWAAAVRDFLGQAPQGGSSDKNYAHSYWAKFFAHGRDDFYQAVWSRQQFPRVAAGLESRLRATGAWRAAASLVNLGEDSL